MEKKVEVSILCETYGTLLTEKQFGVLNDYYNNDLSLSEIAENLQITRQAVRDNILQAEKKLYEYEEKLQLLQNKSQKKVTVDKFLTKIENFKNKQKDAETTKMLEYIQRKVRTL